MFFNRRYPSVKSLGTLLRTYSFGRKNHYDVLNLRNNCSDKEIKEAFIQLSKEYHPDKNKDVKAQEKFVHIVEAYNVLGKPASRARYDSMLGLEADNPYAYRTHVPYNLRKNPNYSYYYASQSKSGGSQENTSTFRTTRKKIPNYVIIVLCTGVALLGVILQVVVVRNMYVAQRKQAQEKSQLLAEELEKVRAVAVNNGNELQTRLLLDKIVSAANPNVATASLGQALANEKK